MSIAYRREMDYFDLKTRSRRGDSNSRPAVYETAALPLSYVGLRWPSLSRLLNRAPELVRPGSDPRHLVRGQAGRWPKLTTTTRLLEVRLPGMTPNPDTTPKALGTHTRPSHPHRRSTAHQMGFLGLSALAASPLRITPVSGHEQLVFWVELAALLSLAVALGRLAARWGQPPVVGQLLAGVVLGPTVFGQIWRSGFAWFLPSGDLVQSSLLLAISTLSLAVLLLTVGFETDITLLRRLGRPASWVTTGSLLIPVGAGILVGLALPVSLRGPSGGAVSFALIVGVALGASSLPVIAEIVAHLGATRRDFGQITLAAGTVNDAGAFLLIALAVAVSGQGALSQLAKVLIGLLLLGALVYIFGQTVIDRLLRLARGGGPDHGTPNTHPSLAVSLVVAMVAAALVQLIGIEGAIGAFVAGVVLARSRFGDAETFRFLSQLSSVFFAPLYFASAGLEANLLLLRQPETALVFGCLVVVGTTTKFFGSYLGATLGGLPRLERVALGVGLNGRGTVQVIAGTVGIGAGIIGGGTYTAIVAMALVTSLATPPLLRRVIRRWEGSPAERARLDLEARFAAHIMVKPGRVLVVADNEVAGVAALQLADTTWPTDAQFTVIYCSDRPSLSRASLDPRSSRSVDWQSVERREVDNAVRSELKLGSVALVIGSGPPRATANVPSTLLTDLLAVAQLPIVIVFRDDSRHAPESPPIPRQLLVTISEGRPSRASLEFGYSLAERTGAQVRLLRIDTSSRRWRSFRIDRGVLRRLGRRRQRSAEELALEQAMSQARGYGVTATAELKTRGDYAKGVATSAAQQDLVILGVHPVATAEGLYFGPAAELLLEATPDRCVFIAVPD